MDSDEITSPEDAEKAEIGIRDREDEAYWKSLEEGRPRWIPVSDRLPEDGQEVLIARVGTDWIGVCYFRAENIDFEMSGPIAGWFATPAPTHWMPLPAPPTPEPPKP